MSFYVLQFFIYANFLLVQSLRRYEFFKKQLLFTFFPLHENRDDHLAGLMEAKPEELGKICPQRKDVIFYAVKFCIHVNFLAVQPFRRYEIFKNNV